ncbi:SDR family oxidoreductase [Glutamicibacter sp. MNS18]|uniref:SDR family oxidoreductase n=1 Tax=Glutamicibacter sp. MNS18 TaxID=2989817 RepID=UPI003531E1F7
MTRGAGVRGNAAEPEDVAQAVLFLSSAQASYITGVALPVGGGLFAASGASRSVWNQQLTRCDDLAFRCGRMPTGNIR